MTSPSHQVATAQRAPVDRGSARAALRAPLWLSAAVAPHGRLLWPGTPWCSPGMMSDGPGTGMSAREFEQNEDWFGAHNFGCLPWNLLWSPARSVAMMAGQFGRSQFGICQISCPFPCHLSAISRPSTSNYSEDSDDTVTIRTTVIRRAIIIIIAIMIDHDSDDTYDDQNDHHDTNATNKNNPIRNHGTHFFKVYFCSKKIISNPQTPSPIPPVTCVVIVSTVSFSMWTSTSTSSPPRKPPPKPPKAHQALPLRLAGETPNRRCW